MACVSRKGYILLIDALVLSVGSYQQALYYSQQRMIDELITQYSMKRELSLHQIIWRTILPYLGACQ